MKKRILFLIHDLGPRGAEKVLVNLVNGIDKSKFDVSLRTLFNWGPNRSALDPDVHYSYWIGRDIRGNSHWMKFWTPAQLWKKIIPEKFDIVVSFLEGPCARVTGGCPDDGTKTAVWIHTPILSPKKFTEGFRNRDEAEYCYKRADSLVFVSQDVKEAFMQFCKPEKKAEILYNIFDSDRILRLAAEPGRFAIDPSVVNWCGIGRLVPLKGWTRMMEIQKKLSEENIAAHFYIIGDGPEQKELERKAKELCIFDSVTFTGYLDNPYAVLSKCDLYVNASEREGFSTAVVESLLCGTPVCTVNIGGMKEILGENNEFGVVSENNDEALYRTVRQFLTDGTYREDYRHRALERAKDFDRNKAIKTTEDLLLSL